MKLAHLRLPFNLRAELSKPQGKLIRGPIEETTPKLLDHLNEETGIIAAVGDVVAQILIEGGFLPHIIITDGYTKREKLVTWASYPAYEEITVSCPAAEITIEAWESIQMAVDMAKHKSKIHLRIEGEEDLLVLPLGLELPDGSIIVYGQPDEGVVLIEVNTFSKAKLQGIISKMDQVS
ncbi:MAG: DUF359 domain-containing protein [Candidatus Kariarchaeaceae archaeon]